MATLVSPAPPPLAADPIWRLSVDQYHAMIDAGILDEDSPVELVEGILLEKMPKKPPHRLTAEEIRAALAAVLPAGWHILTQEPITLTDSEPEPDVVVARGANRDYPDRHPGPGDIAMVIEVSDSTLGRDRGIKQRVYARAGIPVYWIADLINRRVEVRTEPRGDTYHNVTLLTGTDTVTVMLGDLQAGTIQVASLFA